MFTVATVKNVERAVVPGALQVFNIVLHLHLHRVAVIVLAALKLLVAVLAFEALQGPFISGGPTFLTVQQDDGLVGALVALDKFLWTEMEGISALNIVLPNKGYFSASVQNVNISNRSNFLLED